MQMTTLLPIVAVFIVLVVLFMRLRGRPAATIERRLEMPDNSPAATPTSATPPASTATSTPATAEGPVAEGVDAAVETALSDALAAIGGTAKFGPVKVKRTVVMVFKVPSQELAEKIAARERAKGLVVQIDAPGDAAGADTNWKVTVHQQSE